MKRSFLSKTLCTTLAILLLLQALPLSVFANDYGSSNDVETDGILNIIETEPLEISCEIIDSRTEFSKVFLLSDDTFYNINTTYPLHAWENDMWIDLYEGFENVNTVDEVKELVKNIEPISNASVLLTTETGNYSSNANVEPLINSDMCWATEYEAYEIGASDGALRITPNAIIPYTAKNRAINSAYVTFSRADIDEPIESLITIYEGDESVSSENINGLNIVDEFTAVAIKEYSVDITNLYSKWDVNATQLYGVILRARGNDFFTIRNAYFEVYFEEIDWNDPDYTYHTVDMGDGGILYINNYTNTTLYENKLFRLDSKILPIYLSRINDGTNPVVSSSAGFGFTWNIESTISVSNSLGVWNTIDLEKKRFAPNENIIIDNGYQVWKENGSNGIEDQTSIYFYVPNDDVVNNTIDYSRIFIKQGDTKYSFDSTGRLISVERPGVNNIPVCVEITYDSDGNLVRITTEKGVEYELEYMYDSELRKDYLWRIWINDEFAMLFSVDKVEESNYVHLDAFAYNILWYVEDGETIDDSIIYYYSDKYGNIVDIHDIGDNLYSLNYCNTGNRTRGLGNRLDSYVILPLREGTENHYAPKYTISFDMPNSNYREITELDQSTNNETSEIIQYDKEHRIITHKDSTGYCTCVEYDSNGVVSSFAFNESENSLIVDGSFEEENVFDSNWAATEDSIELAPSTWGTAEHGDFEIKMNANNEPQIAVTQEVQGNFIADKTYVVGAWVKVDQTIPADERKIGIQVLDASDENNIYEVAFGTIDNSLDREWQYRLQAFKLSTNCSKLRINLIAFNQIGEIRFDEVTLFEANDSKADLIGVDFSSAIEYSYNNGLITKETMTDGVYSLNKSYEYYNDGSISKINDINGLDTYYTYSYDDKDNSITSIGSVKDSEGNIADAMEIVYDAIGFLSSISRTVSVLDEGTSTEETNYTDLNMSTQYSWLNEEQIATVEHNDMLYSFNYNPRDMLTSISVSVDSDITNNSDEEIYYENNHDVVSYSYINNTYLGSITYANDYAVRYSYKNGKINTVKCYYPASENNLVATYTYTYTAGIISSIKCEDSEGSCTIKYDEYNNVESIIVNGTELYCRSINDNGDVVETFDQAYFTGTNNTPTDLITTTNTITSSPNSSNGDITNSSTIIVNKNASDNKHSEMTYERSSVTDYFNRITSKQTQLVYNTGDEYGKIYNVDVITDYDYKIIDVGTTSGLVSNYETVVSGDCGNASSGTREYISYSRNFEYDHRGNLKYVYSLAGTVETPCEYYEYDEAGQLITSIDFIRGEVISYTYNEGGNLTSKVFYDYNSVEFDCENRTLVDFGAKIHTTTYSFHRKADNYSASTIENDSHDTYDMLIGITETDYTVTSETYEPLTTDIDYDALGNPLNYVGMDIDNAVVSGNLIWNGYNLSKFENENMIIEYQYDKDGYRNKKVVYSKNTDGTTSLTYKILYVWNNGVLTSLFYQGGNNEELSLNIIYDQEGSPTGYITSLGIPYYFLKDVNENVIGLVHPNGETICSITYDAWGTPTYIYHGENLLAQMVAKATAVFNPITYHGYIYDYETGMYCSKGRCYSPSWGRYINPDEPNSLSKRTNDVLDANLYLFSNNDPVNNVDTYAMWSRNHFELGWDTESFSVEASELFASRSFCTIFANQFVKENGEWLAGVGYTYNGMTPFQIASAIFAHYIGKKAPEAINKINASWGDGWLIECQESEDIQVYIADYDEEYTWRTNAWKYEKIWYAAKEIKTHAWERGVYITI